MHRAELAQEEGTVLQGVELERYGQILSAQVTDLSQDTYHKTQSCVVWSHLPLASFLPLDGKVDFVLLYTEVSNWVFILFFYFPGVYANRLPSGSEEILDFLMVGQWTFGSWNKQICIMRRSRTYRAKGGML